MKIRFESILNRDTPGKPKGPLRPMERELFEVKRSILRKLGRKVAVFRPLADDVSESGN